MESFNAPQESKQENQSKINDLNNEQKNFGAKEPNWWKMRELPGDGHNLNLRLEENIVRIREVETKLQSE